jgi:LAO/AO transport system kinase
MQEHATDPDVFIRSMATRGHLGGMALAAPEAVRILDAAGFDLVIIETVGVGQAEIDVAAATDTTLVVLAPGLGDAIQMAKAGILEVADVFVVNKADRDGAAEVQRELRQMLHLGAARPWDPPVLATVASDGTGIDELWADIERHHAWLVSTGALAVDREAAVVHEVRALAAERLASSVQAQLADDAGLRARLRDHELDPYAAVDELIRRLAPG